MKRCCGMLSWEVGEAIIIDDFEREVEEERLELRRGEVHRVGKKGMGGEKQVLAALALMEEFILRQCQLGFKESRDVRPITDVAVPKVGDANEIRDLYREICEIPETERNRIGNGKEIENGLGALGGGNSISK